jgi:hypothetical protein
MFFVSVSEIRGVFDSTLSESETRVEAFFVWVSETRIGAFFVSVSESRIGAFFVSCFFGLFFFSGELGFSSAELLLLSIFLLGAFARKL